MNSFIKYLIGITFIVGLMGCSTKVDNALSSGESIQAKMCKQGYDNCRTLGNGYRECKDKWCR